MPKRAETAPCPLDILDLMCAPPLTDETARNSEMGPGLRNLGEEADIACRIRAIDTFDRVMKSACNVGSISIPDLSTAREIMIAERLDPPGIRTSLNEDIAGIC